MEGRIGVLLILLGQFAAEISEPAPRQEPDGQVGQHDSSSDEYTCQHGDTQMCGPDGRTKKRHSCRDVPQDALILGLPALFRPQVCRNLAALLNYHGKKRP
jgi:hypothetical protein